MMSVIFASVLVLITPIFSFVDLTVHAIGHRSQSDAEAILFGEEFAERVSSIHAGNARLRELRAACNASSFLGPRELPPRTPQPMP